MLACVNSHIQNFLFNQNPLLDSLCPPACDSHNFFVHGIAYRDKNSRATGLIKRAHNVSDDHTVFFLEIELKTNQIELNIEKITYSTGILLYIHTL